MIFRFSILSRNCTTARGTDGAASATARRFSSSISASLANAFACLINASIRSCENFVFLLPLFESDINSLSFLAAVTVTSDAS